MTNKLYKKQHLLNLICENETNALKIISNVIVDHSRWSVHHSVVFQDLATNLYYRFKYSKGATEYQHEFPLDYEPDDVPCDEVKPVEKTIVVYE